ncbi:hypothetical protein jhhlp_001347 [Lomentospora prolificans]|uniref:Palmitoyltransferase n=1 Tax=Lomentospora prolificans TaxID=41688 RepID=A0A2N3NI19_9PEZI|nr:hypothetical protein jhhlp_001347 [Lomentospora prolificans]
MSSTTSTSCGVRWITRLVPCFLLAIVIYATYVVIARICVDYLLRERHETGLAAAFIVLYFIFFFLGITCYIRTIWVIKKDPSLVPLEPNSRGAQVLRSREHRRHKGLKSVFGRPYNDEESSIGYSPPDANPDSPGLERFYSKDVFVCESDGRPKWCHDCGQWKPDRASHSREIERCVRKMDHYCPWVGGMVAENSFKFFAQFTFYAWLFCAVVLSATAYTIAKQLEDGGVPDGHTFAILVLSGFLGFFSCAMSGTALRFISKNMTNVDLLKKQMSYQLAVRVPLGTPPTERFMTITYPLPRLASVQQQWQPPQPLASSQAQQPTAQTNGEAESQLPTETDENPSALRDRLAQRTFAILRTEPGENPWDLGYRRNWIEVMGSSPIGWFLPITRSPCTAHDNLESEYPYGPVLADLKARYGLDPKPWTDKEQGIELRDQTRR